MNRTTLFVILFFAQLTYANSGCMSVREKLDNIDTEIVDVRRIGSRLTGNDELSLRAKGNLRIKLVKLVQQKVDMNGTKIEICRTTPSEAVITYTDYFGQRKTVTADSILESVQLQMSDSFFDFRVKQNQLLDL